MKTIYNSVKDTPRSVGWYIGLEHRGRIEKCPSEVQSMAKKYMFNPEHQKEFTIEMRAGKRFNTLEHIATIEILGLFALAGYGVTRNIILPVIKEAYNYVSSLIK